MGRSDVEKIAQDKNIDGELNLKSNQECTDSSKRATTFRRLMPSKTHQVLAHTSSVETNPKRKTERLSSAPGVSIDGTSADSKNNHEKYNSSFNHATPHKADKTPTSIQLKMFSKDKMVVNTQEFVESVNANLEASDEENDFSVGRNVSQSCSRRPDTGSSSGPSDSEGYNYTPLPLDDELLPAVTVNDTPYTHQDIKLHSLQSNITLNIKPEAIRGTVAPFHTAKDTKSNSNQKVASDADTKQLKDKSKETVINIGDTSPVKPKAEKPTSFLSRLLSIPKDQSNISTIEALKFLSGGQHPKKSKKKNFGSMVVLAGSNSDSGSISDRNSSSLSNKSHLEMDERRLPRSLHGTPRLPKEDMRRKESSTTVGEITNTILEEQDRIMGMSSSKVSLNNMMELSIDDGQDWFDAAARISENWSRGCFMDEIRNEISLEKFTETPVGKSGVGKRIPSRTNGGSTEFGLQYDDYFSQLKNQSVNTSKLQTPDSVITNNKKYPSSIDSNNSINISNTHKLTNVSLQKMLQHRGLVRQRNVKRAPKITGPDIDDARAVREIEAGLLNLMEQFEAGDLTAFGKDSRLRQMEVIREQQESLMKLHLEIGAQQDLFQPLSKEGVSTNTEHMSTLMEKLTCLSQAIDKLQDNTNSSERKRRVSPRLQMEKSLSEEGEESDKVILRSRSSVKLPPDHQTLDNNAQIIITDNVNYSSSKENKLSQLNVMPLLDRKTLSTDGKRSYLVDETPNLEKRHKNKVAKEVRAPPPPKSKHRKLQKTQCTGPFTDNISGDMTELQPMTRDREGEGDTFNSSLRETDMSHGEIKRSTVNQFSRPPSNPPPIHRPHVSRAPLPPPLPARTTPTNK